MVRYCILETNDCPFDSFNVCNTTDWSPHSVSFSLIQLSSKCGVSCGVGLYTDEQWRKFAQENVVNRFNNNPKKCYQYPSINTLLDVKMFGSVHGSTASAAST